MRADDPSGGVAVEACAVVAEEDRSLAAFADREVDGAGGSGCERDGDDLAALAQDREGAVPAFEAERFDVRADRFGDAQPVEREQAIRAWSWGLAEPGGDEHGADFVAVESGRVRLVVESRAADVHRG